MPIDAVDVEGLSGLQQAFALAGREVKGEMTGVLKGLAEPVRVTAQGLALEEIPRMTMEWSRMRTGIGVGSVYVAPVKRGVNSRKDNRFRRPNLFNLLLDRALEPALGRNLPGVVAGVERWLNGVADDWGKR